MAHTATEKILARAAGLASVKPGDVIYPEPDLIVLHDLHAHLFLRSLWKLGVRKLWRPERVMVVIDHRVPVMSSEHADIHDEIREWVSRFGITHFFDVGDSGISHQLQIEKGLVRPGMLVISKDVHSPNAGAVGALGIPLVYDVPAVLALGSGWIRVPETLRVNLDGRARPGVMPRDVAQHFCAAIGYEECDYRVVEWGGSYVDGLSVDGRQVLCNPIVDVGAKSGMVNPDATTNAHIRALTDLPYQPVCSDVDATYARVYEFDVSNLVPQVAVPPSPDNVVPVRSVANLKIDRAFVGSCAGGMLEDLRAAASVLKGRRVNRDVRMLIAPSTQGVHIAALKEGLIEIFARAGATVLPPGCSACDGGVYPLGSGDRAISTSTRNEPGRMGPSDAEIYLANAATVAAAAVAGCIIDPADLDPRKE